ncbi:MAG: MFS transporter, partial [Hyphomonadaceae bacterium]|nr:MFS transporter [Clostridia bacterium]
VTASTILLVNLASGYMIFALIAVIGFSYGGFLGVFPALTADFWGTKSMGMNYGIVLLGFGVGAIVSSYIAGYYKNLANVTKDLTTMQPAFIIASVAAILGVLLIAFLKPPIKKVG